jgi:class 3 adenylate cyclase
MGASVLATEEFVSRDGESEAWISRGEHDLKGIQNVVRVFELGAI